MTLEVCLLGCIHQVAGNIFCQINFLYLGVKNSILVQCVGVDLELSNRRALVGSGPKARDPKTEPNSYFLAFNLSLHLAFTFNT